MAPHSPDQANPDEGLSASELLAILAQKEAALAELEAVLRELDEQLDLDCTPDDQRDDAQHRRSRKRERGFSAALRRERIELLLADADKEGALKSFFSKVKEELSHIPPHPKVIEYLAGEGGLCRY